MIKTRKLFARALYAVMALALVTVMVPVTPVMAARVGEPTVTLAVYKVGVAGDYSIVFTTHDALDSGDTISVVFPDDTDLTTYNDVNVTVNDGADVTVTSEAVQGQRVDILLGAACAADAVTVAFAEAAVVKNPSTAGTYQLQVYTSLETTARTSKDYTVYLRTSNTPASVGVVTDTSTVAGTESAYTVSVELGEDGNITYGQTITIDFPVGTTVPGTIATSDVTVEGVEPDSVDVSDLEVTIGIALGEVIANDEVVTVVFALGAGLANPEDAGAYTVDAWTSVETVAATSTDYNITEEAEADITQLVFSTFPATTAYDTAGTIVVQAQDQYGNPVNVSTGGGAPITVNFTTSNTDTGTLSPATADMTNGTNSVTFTYEDTVSGATLTAAVDAGETVVWADAVGTFIITPQVALLHGAEPVANYNTITLAIAAAVSGDTIEVGPGTYVENLIIGVADLTLVSTEDRDTTIIDASSANPGIDIQADDVTFEGFTVTMDDAVADGIWIGIGTEGVSVKDNAVTDITDWTAIVLRDNVTGAIVSGNLISDCNGGIILSDGATGCTVSTNTITDCEDGGSGIGLQVTTSTTITGNNVSNGGWGIHIGGDVNTSCLIDDNILTGNRHDGIKIETGVTITNLSIIRNDITANEEDGIFIAESVTGVADIVINNNNIYGNGLEGDPPGRSGLVIRYREFDHNNSRCREQLLGRPQRTWR